MRVSGLKPYEAIMKNAGEIEAHIAHLEKTVDELSAVVARQDGEIAQLTRRVAMLLAREAERESAEGGSALMGNQKPPHY